jgi:hypothetical protein
MNVAGFSMAMRSIYSGLYELNSIGKFQLPDIPEDRRIKAHTPKIRRHATKRRINKLHDNRIKEKT